MLAKPTCSCWQARSSASRRLRAVYRQRIVVASAARARLCRVCQPGQCTQAARAIIGNVRNGTAGLTLAMYLRPLTERAAIRFGRLPDRTSQLGMAANVL